jgi:hypothetical protein
MSHVTADADYPPQQLTDFACWRIKAVSVAGRYLRLLSISFADGYGRVAAVHQLNAAAENLKSELSNLNFEISNLTSRYSVASGASLGV